MSFKIEEVHRDDEILCIEKPPGTLSIPDRYDPEKKNLYHFLKHKYPSIIPVHRLDRDTSGVMVWALNEDAHQFLNTQFERRNVHKKYLAIVQGTARAESGEIDAPIVYTASGKGTTARKGKSSLTSWSLVEQFQGFALLEVFPHTGRTHQIRIHLKEIGLPLAVDSLYGQKQALYAYEIKSRKKFNFPKDKELRPLIARHTLHASELSFIHPGTKKQVTFKASLPKDFRAVLNQLRKWRSNG